jgi:hypothetical protein
VQKTKRTKKEIVKGVVHYILVMKYQTCIVELLRKKNKRRNAFLGKKGKYRAVQILCYLDKVKISYLKLCGEAIFGWHKKDYHCDKLC